MTEDQQLTYDQYTNLKELEARFNREADVLEQSARDQRTIASSYKSQADALAKQLGF